MNQENLGELFGLPVFYPFTLDKVKKLLIVKAQKTKELSESKNISFQQSAFETQQVLETFLDSLEPQKRSELIDLIDKVHIINQYEAKQKASEAIKVTEEIDLDLYNKEIDTVQKDYTIHVILGVIIVLILFAWLIS